MMNSENINEGNPLLLSKIIDNLFICNEKFRNVQKMKNDMDYFVEKNSRGLVGFSTGSYAEGFVIISSDVDTMVIFKGIVVVTSEQTSRYNPSGIVLMMRGDGCRPGYTRLQVVYTEHINIPWILDSIIPMHALMYMSSDIFRENILKGMKDGSYISHGPCVTITTHSTPMDFAFAFHCPSWPDDAKEWPNRTRVFGWPPETLINKIVRDGCHIVPIGDKCSGDTLLQWRISFATAERQLVYSMNHTQFQVYALLKYILKQIKYWLKRDIGEDILCSYFIKTLVFHAVENSPQTLWQEKNLFVCFWLCFTMLLDWVHVGCCPNYFILTNNMFQLKVHGTNQTKLLQILHEVHQMKWKCFSVGNIYRPSIWELLNTEMPQELYSNLQKVGRVFDSFIHGSSHVLSFENQTSDTLRSLKPSLVLLSKVKSELEERCAYKIFARLLFNLAQKTKTVQVHGGNGGNKSQYKQTKRIKHWAIPYTSLGTNLLYLATFVYLRGNYRQALQLCRKVKALITDIDENRRYSVTGSSTFHQEQLLILDPLVYVDSTNLTFCLPHLYPEIRHQSPEHVFVYPTPYAAFLSFLCSHDFGDTQGCNEELFYLETHCKHTYFAPFKIQSIHQTLLGIAYQIKGDGCKAKEAYRKSLYYNPHGNPASERLKAL